MTGLPPNLALALALVVVLVSLAVVLISLARMLVLTRRLREEHDRLQAAVHELSREYHLAIHETEYAGTRADWTFRALKAEQELAALKAYLDTGRTPRAD